MSHNRAFTMFSSERVIAEEPKAFFKISYLQFNIIRLLVAHKGREVTNTEKLSAVT